mmetsp:Transcript_51420/g.149362  ORF Transcript_51420/g.149362 Transcript_51420/m.149362 type:complete len:243 (-) Transcript_51420:367-1095(-)
MWPPHGHADDAGQAVAGGRVPHGAAALESALVDAPGHGLITSVNPYPRQPRLTAEGPLGMQALESSHHVLAPVRRVLPGPLQVVLVPQSCLEVRPREDARGPRHLQGLQLVTLFPGWAEHGAYADACTSEDLRPRLHQEDTDVALGHPLNKVRTDALLKPLGAGPEKHGLVDENPAARSRILFDPRLHLVTLKEIACWVVRVHKTDQRSILGVLHLAAAGVPGRALVLAVLDLDVRADAVGS